jgi:hypothetical protein
MPPAGASAGQGDPIQMSEPQPSVLLRAIVIRAALLAGAAIALAGAGAALLASRTGSAWAGLVAALVVAALAGGALLVILRRGLAPLEEALALLRRLGQATWARASIRRAWACSPRSASR